MKNKIIMVYTDGACSNNPEGPGGWAAILNFDKKIVVLSGNAKVATNNKMELKAVVEAVKALVNKGYKRIIINSDSAYVVNAFNKNWIEGWATNGWKTKAGSPLANCELWKELYSYYKMKDVTLLFVKVAGHSGHTLNEMADAEARKQVEIVKQQF